MWWRKESKSVWDDLRRRQRWCYSVMLGGIAVPVVIKVLNIQVGVSLDFWWVVWGVACIFTMWRLAHFPCPRCGQPFFASLGGEGFGGRCTRCGLRKWEKNVGKDKTRWAKRPETPLE